MADNIIQFNSPVDQLHPSDLGSTAYEQLGRHVSNDFNEAGRFIGSGIATAGDEWQQADARAETVDMYKDLSTLQISAHQSLQDTIAKGDPNDHNLLTKWNADTLNGMFDKIADKYTNPLVKARFEEERARITESLVTRGLGMQSDLAGRTAIANDKVFTDQLANHANIDPASVSDLATQSDRYVDTLTDSGAVPTALGPAMKLEKHHAIYDSAADGIVHKVTTMPNVTPDQIDGVLKVLRDPKSGFIDNMTPGKFNEMEDKLLKARETQAGVAGEIAAQAFPNVLKQVEDNGANADNVATAQRLIDGYQGASPRETAIHKAEMQRDLDASVVVGKQVSGVRDMSDQDGQQKLRDIRATMDQEKDPDKLKGEQDAYKAIDTALKKRDEEFKKDPARYGIDNNAVVQGAWQNFAKNPSAATFNDYAIKQSVFQKKLYPFAVPHLVTNEMRDQIAGSLASITRTPEGAAGAATVLRAWAQTSGQYWPQMAQELHHDKVMNDAQFVAATLYSKPEAASLAETVLRANTTDKKDLIAMAGGLTDAQATRAAAAALAPLQATLEDAANGRELLTAYEHAISDVLLYKGSRVRDVSNDATAIANKMIMDEFDFRGTLRVPKSAGVDADKVTYGARAVLGVIDSHDLVPPTGYSGLGPMDQAKAYALNVKAYGHWVTAEDGNSAILYDEQNHPVWEKRMGKTVPVQLKWKDLNELGDTQLNMVDKAFRFMTGKQL